jgi:hypothetical protein
VTALARLRNRRPTRRRGLPDSPVLADRPSRRAPGEPHLHGPTLQRIAANFRGAFGAIVSADEASAWLRLSSQTPPKDGCVDSTPRAQRFATTGGLGHIPGSRVV